VDPRFRLAAGGTARQSVLQLPLGVSLGGQQRMQQAMDDQTMTVHDHGDRIDQEGHVVGHDIDHRVRRVPAVAVKIRSVQSDNRFFRRSRFAQAKMLHGRTEKLFRAGVTGVAQLAITEVAFEVLVDARGQILLLGDLAQVAPQIEGGFIGQYHAALLVFFIYLMLLGSP
jgi:hypothetical protein